jgi:DNA polymerase V
VEWSDNKIALCYMNNEFTLKRIRIENDKCYLIPSNTKYKPIEVNAENNVMIWGIVTYSIKKHE